MNVLEIYRLKQQSPALKRALGTHRVEVWHFLRYQTTRAGNQFECEHCHARLYPLLQSIYRGSLCIDCQLYELLVGGPLVHGTYRDPRSRDYDARYDEQCKMWDEFCHPTLPDDYDGPPIWWA